MAYRTLHPVFVRSLWEDAVLRLSQLITQPRDFMNLRDFVLTLLLSYSWNTDRFLQNLEESKDEFYWHVNLCIFENRDSKCLDCVQQRFQDIGEDLFLSYVRRSTLEVRQAALEQTLEMLNPCCGCLCEEHVKTRFHYELFSRFGMLYAIQKCLYCKKVYPKDIGDKLDCSGSTFE